jgi:hypothetical protein
VGDTREHIGGTIDLFCISFKSEYRFHYKRTKNIVLFPEWEMKCDLYGYFSRKQPNKKY